jgi:ABC-type Mn2+/Zn2+ transport system permease subunit
VPKGSVSRDQVQELIDAETAGDVAAAIAAALLLGAPDVEESFDPIGAATMAALTVNLNYLARGRRRYKTKQFTKLACYLAAAAGNICLSLYTSTNGGATFSLVATTGNVTASVGLNDIATTAAFDWVAGADYWFDYRQDNATSTPLRASVVAAAIGGLDRRAITALETTVAPATLTVDANQGARVWMRAS